jgi:putative transport protein
MMVIVSVGYLLGHIKIKGFRLESSAILFIALAAGHYGMEVPELFKFFGLSLFIYSIGLQAGPKVSMLFKKEGKELNILAFSIVTIGAFLTALGVLIFGFSKEISVGIFAGALTSTPGLASAYEATQSGTTSIGYGIAYPIGVIGVILFIKFLPLILGKDIKKEEEKENKRLQKDQVPVINRLIEISNPNVFGKSIRTINLSAITGCVISRLLRNNSVEVPRGNTVLEKGDIVRVVGAEDKVAGAVMLLGHSSETKIPRSELDMARFVVTNPKLVGKKIKELKVRMKYEANITRVGRSGIDIPASPDFKIQWGDRISVVAEHHWLDDLKKYFGDDIKKANEASVFSVFLGITIGILIGMIPFSIGKILSFKMGITGGILLSGLVLGNRGRLGPVVWRVPFNILNFIRELGLVLFLSAVGSQAGKHLLEIIQTNGILLFLWAALVMAIPMLLILLLSTKIFNLNILQLLGLVPGGMTSTPGFATASSITLSQTPSTIYATVYPVAMLAMILWTKILILIPF